jgi:DUF4097 and DUF4098 domain-containing protein YvlB
MTRRTDRRFALLAGGGLALFLTFCAAIQVAAWSVGKVEGNSHRVLSGTIDKLMVESSNGDVTILRSLDGKIHVDGRAEGTLRAPAPAIDVQGSVVRVAANCPVWGFGECHSRVVLRVPTGTTVRVDSGSGDIVARDLAGGGDLETSSGDVVVDGASGDLTLESGSGDIVARELRSEQVRADTGSGDVDLRFTAPPRGAEAKTGSGDVRILVPPGVEQYDVDTETGSGETDSGVTDYDGSGRNLRAETGSGDVTVDYGG